MTNPFADAFAHLPIAEDSAFPLPGTAVERAASLSHGADVVTQSTSDPRPQGVTTADDADVYIVHPVEGQLSDAAIAAIGEALLVHGGTPQGPSDLVPQGITASGELSDASLREIEAQLEQEAALGKDTLTDDAKRLAVESAILVARHEEWHVTVKGDHRRWAAFCDENDVQPLFIELADTQHTLQLMCAMSFDPQAIPQENHAGVEYVGTSFLERAASRGFTPVRIKHEVSELHGEEQALYWEAHAKFNGPWRTDRKGVSRDLYRAHEGRWYMTRRSREPFDATAFGERARSMAKPSRFVEVEYEACILDTNRALDGGWL